MPLVTLPDAELLQRVSPVPVDIDLAVWDLTDPADAPAGRIDLVVLPYMAPATLLRSLTGLPVAAVQSQALGFEGVADVLDPGVVFCNAAGVHETTTAELVVALVLSASATCRASPPRSPAGRGSRSSVHATADLPGLLGAADVVVLAVPLTTATHHLADASFLAAMRPGALLVNVARGPVVDTAALLDAARAGRVRAALDVTDPEPLPPRHPLWSAPGVVVTPHVGGRSDAMAPRVEALLAAQFAHLARGEPLANRVRLR